MLQRSMYSNSHAAMPPPQSRSVAPETFLLDQDAQQSLPPDSIVALQQVDNRMFALQIPPMQSHMCLEAASTHSPLLLTLLQSSISSSLRRLTGNPISIFVASCCRPANMFLACYGECIPSLHCLFV